MLKLEYKPYTLNFNFEAGTSRGVLTERPVWFIHLFESKTGISGIGEVAPLIGLSVEKPREVENQLLHLQDLLPSQNLPNKALEVSTWIDEVCTVDIPSVRFGLEMAVMDVINGGKQIWFDNGFTQGIKSIPINGLIWMGDRKRMKERIKEKMDDGFRCLKMKIGAIDFEDELKLLRFIRGISSELIIRLDANGAMKTNKALGMLQKLSEFNIHSIEQPILPAQPEAMALLCKKSQVPIALDEELIGNDTIKEKITLLTEINPAYIILKPSMLGGYSRTAEWISIAERQGIGWWITSALESNIGLNAISQFTAEYDELTFQGLGTGQLFDNNFSSPLALKSDQLHYVPGGSMRSPF